MPQSEEKITRSRENTIAKLEDAPQQIVNIICRRQYLFLATAIPSRTRSMPSMHFGARLVCIDGNVSRSIRRTDKSLYERRRWQRRRRRPQRHRLLRPRTLLIQSIIFNFFFQFDYSDSFANLKHTHSPNASASSYRLWIIFFILLAVSHIFAAGWLTLSGGHQHAPDLRTSKQEQLSKLAPSCKSRLVAATNFRWFILWLLRLPWQQGMWNIHIRSIPYPVQKK